MWEINLIFFLFKKEVPRKEKEKKKSTVVLIGSSASYYPEKNICFSFLKGLLALILHLLINQHLLSQKRKPTLPFMPGLN